MHCGLLLHLARQELVSLMGDLLVLLYISAVVHTVLSQCATGSVFISEHSDS